LKLCVSKKKVKDILQRSKSTNIPKKLDWKENAGIIVLGMDNCAYHNSHSYIRDNSTPNFVNTINTYRRFWKQPLNAMLDDESDIFLRDFVDNKQQFRFVANFI
jgi:fatty acid/phospholipid biosynthesis enzyme